jgi:hypothetical protein
MQIESRFTLSQLLTLGKKMKNMLVKCCIIKKKVMIQTISKDLSQLSTLEKKNENMLVK